MPSSKSISHHLSPVTSDWLQVIAILIPSRPRRQRLNRPAEFRQGRRIALFNVDWCCVCPKRLMNMKSRYPSMITSQCKSNIGSIQNGVRPVLVVQCDEGNQASTTTVVAALTSVIKKRYLPSHIILGDKFGLKEPSMVMLEQLKTVNQSELVEYIGFVDSEYLLRKVTHGLMFA